MPIFEYECQDCGNRFDVLVQPSQLDAPQTCPACQSAKVEKLMSTFAPKVASSGGGANPGCEGCPKAAPGSGFS